jgi:hypothetical protein
MLNIIRKKNAIQKNNEAFIKLAYSLILKRDPDPEGLQDYLEKMAKGRMTAAEVLLSLRNSAEYQLLNALGEYTQDPEIAPYLTEQVRRDSEELAHGEFLAPGKYQCAWQSIFDNKKPLIIGQQEYGVQHKQRFYELFNAVALLCRKLSAPKIIEFGISEFSAMHKHFNPDTVLHTADRPTTEDYIGFTKKVCEQVAGCERHFEIDLNNPATIAEHLSGQLQTYDLVIFTEILEHLIINPIELIAQLLNLLNDEGHLYLTTPNFYRKQNLSLIQARHNPQPVYPGAQANWDAHFHHREYCLKELLAMIEQAGGKTARFYFSACWDGRAENLPMEERGNLVFVIKKSQPKAGS